MRSFMPEFRDVAVVPATASLSPGSVMLALTFGLPVVAPAGGAPAEILDPATGRTFDPGASATGPGGLLEALRGAGDLVGPAARAAARAVAEAFPPGPTSHRFLDALRDRADGP
jgi:hypothetical protein